ncbi:MAG: FAD:protein FMN transferase [Lautropia sp.]
MRQVLVPLAPAAPASLPARPRLFRLDGETMGTVWRVALVASADRPIAPLRAAIETELARVVAQMSSWEPDSDLCRFNRAPAGSRVALPAALFQVLLIAEQIAAASDGACDATAGELVDLWGFGPGSRFRDPTFRPPDEAQVAAARARTGWQRLALDAGDGTALQPGGVRLDLSGIAKGFAVDQVARRLARDGIGSCLVEIGGELRGSGVKPDGEPWWVALDSPGDALHQVEVPQSAGPHAAGPHVAEPPLVALYDIAIATSGDYLRRFEHDGRRYAHTIDPRTGWPVANDIAAVTVIDRDCVRADALATVLMVLGAEDGLAWAERQSLAARFVLRHGCDFAERVSPAWTAMLQ